MREKSNLLAVSVVVVNSDGNVLLRKRLKEPDEGSWELFASYPYIDEMPLVSAAQRILEEKAGITEKASIEFAGRYYDTPGRHPGKACVPIIFKATLAMPFEGTENVRWFTPAELASVPIALDNKTTLSDLGFIS